MALPGIQINQLLRETNVPGPDRELDTEGEKWGNSRLGFINSILDTFEPGLRLCVQASHPDDGMPVKYSQYLTMMILGDPEPRLRHLPTVLRQLADQIDIKEPTNG